MTVSEIKKVAEKWNSLGDRNPTKKKIRVERLRVSYMTMYRIIKACELGDVPDRWLLKVEVMQKELS
jgi:hypothetical protein